eukprot:TRINITY_DN43113_c0_g1_i1.p1 TRINITY_DN43113_c0_g1~~TRINITY_DN43113_c0_g1_i1.p1  ORF type:complete len:972 (+),score=216.30 TRINITY_DN43113_c0_g1_i1:64-2916(+)
MGEMDSEPVHQKAPPELQRAYFAALGEPECVLSTWPAPPRRRTAARRPARGHEFIAAVPNTQAPGLPPLSSQAKSSSPPPDAADSVTAVCTKPSLLIALERITTERTRAKSERAALESDLGSVAEGLRLLSKHFRTYGSVLSWMVDVVMSSHEALTSMTHELRSAAGEMKELQQAVLAGVGSDLEEASDDEFEEEEEEGNPETGPPTPSESRRPSGIQEVLEARVRLLQDTLDRERAVNEERMGALLTEAQGELLSHRSRADYAMQAADSSEQRALQAEQMLHQSKRDTQELANSVKALRQELAMAMFKIRERDDESEHLRAERDKLVRAFTKKEETLSAMRNELTEVKRNVELERREVENLIRRNSMAPNCGDGGDSDEETPLTPRPNLSWVDDFVRGVQAADRTSARCVQLRTATEATAHRVARLEDLLFDKGVVPEEQLHHANVGRWIAGAGIRMAVPAWLRFKGRVRDIGLSRKTMTRKLQAFWKFHGNRRKDEMERGGAADFGAVVAAWIEKEEPDKKKRPELAYSMRQACRRWQYDLDCQLFLDIVEGRLSEHAYASQLALIESLRTWFVGLDVAANGVVTGRVSRTRAIGSLEDFFSWYSVTDVRAMGNLLRESVGGPDAALINYPLLLSEDADGRRSDFVDAIRDNHLMSIREHVAETVDVLSALRNEESTPTIARVVAKLREIDESKPRAEILKFVMDCQARATGHAFAMSESDRIVLDRIVAVCPLIHTERSGQHPPGPSGQYSHPIIAPRPAPADPEPQAVAEQEPATPADSDPDKAVPPAAMPRAQSVRRAPGRRPSFAPDANTTPRESSRPGELRRKNTAHSTTSGSTWFKRRSNSEGQNPWYGAGTRRRGPRSSSVRRTPSPGISRTQSVRASARSPASQQSTDTHPATPTQKEVPEMEASPLSGVGVVDTFETSVAGKTASLAERSPVEDPLADQ